MKKILATLTLSVLALAGCSSSNGSKSDSTPTGTNAPPEVVATTETPTPTPTPTSTEPETLKFGETNTWEDNISIRVSAPKVFDPTEYAAGTEGFKYFVVFTITVVNKSGAAYDPTDLTDSVQSNDTEGSRVFDSQGTSELGTKILNGRQGTFKAAYGVANPKDIVLEVTPSYEHASAIWTS